MPRFLSLGGHETLEHKINHLRPDIAEMSASMLFVLCKGNFLGDKSIELRLLSCWKTLHTMVSCLIMYITLHTFKWLCMLALAAAFAQPCPISLEILCYWVLYLFWTTSIPCQLDNSWQSRFEVLGTGPSPFFLLPRNGEPTNDNAPVFVVGQLVIYHRNKELY
jgi:hypothetical protein